MTSPLLTAEEISNYNEVSFHGDGSSYEYTDVHGLCHAQLVAVVKWLEEPCKEHPIYWNDPKNPHSDGRQLSRSRKDCHECMESLKELVK